jgi:hypothetical protein
MTTPSFIERLLRSLHAACSAVCAAAGWGMRGPRQRPCAVPVRVQAGMRRVR